MASELKAKVSSAVKDAMRAKAKEELSVLRMVMSEFKCIEVDERIELDDARVLGVLDKLVKQRKDSAKQYQDADRKDLADVELFEIDVIQKFLPQALTADEIAQVVRDAITECGADSMKDMGKVMAIVKPAVQGRADMGDISKIVKEQLV